MVLRLRRLEPADLIRALGAHRALGGALALAVLVRVAVGVAQRPALFFSDSWVYAGLAYAPGHIGIAAERPPGYSVLLALLALPGRSLLALTVLQHLAGLATGALTYALLVRGGIGRTLAAAAAAVVLLDGYAIALEQHVMPEAAFTVALVASAYLLVHGEGRRALALSGLLLGAAVLLRTAGAFALPAWLAYAATRALPRPARALAILCALLPVVGLAGYYTERYGRVGLSGADGWFLYARVGEMARCEGASIAAEARPLCAGPKLDSPVFYLFAPSSPAVRRFGGVTTDRAREARSNRVLGSFALSVISAHPDAYAGIVARDLGRFFRPGSGPDEREGAIYLPDAPRRGPPYFEPRARAAYFPGYEPAVHFPNAIVRAYAAVIHTPRWLLAALTLAALAALGAAAIRRHAFAAVREVALLEGMALGMLLGTAATAGFRLRYLVPVVPLLLAGGTLAAAGAWPLRGGRRSPPAGGHTGGR